VSHPTPTDRERFEALYRSNYGAVVRYAARRSGPAAAEEVAAETFATAWRRLDRIPDAEPLPWLLVTARNVLANGRRSATRAGEKQREHAATVAEPSARDPAEALAERDAVVRAFGTLSEPDRDALRLVAWDGLTLAAGARVAGTTRVAFAMRVSRARRRLAAALEEPDTALLAAPSPAPTTLESSS
jgi:RNA polymerase sigma-70 factor (ECF subfamily)